YRRLSRFAESRNNLGVILKNSGRAGEAASAFTEALALDPSLREAALNLGQGSSDYWTANHNKYLPGEAMLAPPRPHRIHRAFFGDPVMGFLRGYAKILDLFTEQVESPYVGGSPPNVVRFTFSAVTAVILGLPFWIAFVSKRMPARPSSSLWSTIVRL